MCLLRVCVRLCGCAGCVRVCAAVHVQCPRGDDPMTTNQNTEVQLLYCRATAGFFVLSLDGKVSDRIQVTDTLERVRAALAVCSLVHGLLGLPACFFSHANTRAHPLAVRCVAGPVNRGFPPEATTAPPRALLSVALSCAVCHTLLCGSLCCALSCCVPRAPPPSPQPIAGDVAVTDASGATSNPVCSTTGTVFAITFLDRFGEYVCCTGGRV